MRNPETAKRLADAMNMKKMSAKELSDKSGVSESSISQYLHGLFAPRNRTAAKLAVVLEVDPMWLMGFNVPMEKDESKLLEGWHEITTPNHDFVISMDKISRDMTFSQMKAIQDYAEFIARKKE